MEGVSRFSIKMFLSHSAENFRTGILYCCNNFGYQKNLDKRGGEEYQDFPSKFFCLTVPKNSVGKSFTVAIFSGIEKVWIRGGGEYQDFPSKNFCLTVPKISVGESFTVAIVSGIEKVWIRGGGRVSRFCVGSFLSHSAENFRRGVIYCCIISGIEKVWIRGGGGESIKFFLRKFFVSQCRKLP